MRNRILKYLFFLLAILNVPRLVQGQASYWQQETNYIIDVSLNDADHTLDGFMKLQYVNHSPDTLTFIWFHVWPNAFKNDKTAFSEQLLQNGRIDYYFSNKEQKGYINRLDFRVDNNTLKTEDHPLYIDVIKVYLLKPLAPGEQILITTPFHEKLPKNFSRGGHVGKSYQVTQWYPKPAVYDRAGWHPMPNLDQGEFYSDFGSFDVRITLPKDYVVAATGELQNADEKEWLLTRDGNRPTAPVIAPPKVTKTKPQPGVKKPTPKYGASKTKIKPPPPVVDYQRPTIITLPTKTLQYKQSNIHDFAWFADKDFIVNHDTIQLPGRVIDAYTFYLQSEASKWKNSVSYIKRSVHYRSAVIGEYPYNVVSAVETHLGFDGGMEYPTITSIGPLPDAKTVDLVIDHEVGHNWFYGMLATNERQFPWMDEGINVYYTNRYEALYYPPSGKETWLSKRMPEDKDQLSVDVLGKQKRDQPISTPSVEFTEQNYNDIAYSKTAIWMKQIEDYVGIANFDQSMQAYFRQWQFKHPYPEDFKQVMEKNAGKDVSAFFIAANKKGPISKYTGPKKIKPVFLFSFKDYEHINYINIVPVPGFNKYDKIMIGLAIHNYNLPPSNFQFFAAPLYATGSKQLNGIGRLSYTWRPDNRFSKIELGVGGARFSTLDGVDSNGNKIFSGYYKIAPSLRFTFKNKIARSTVEKWIEWRTFFIGENPFSYSRKSTDMEFYPGKGVTTTRYLNQLTYQVTDYRTLYPYDVQLQVQQGNGFYRATATGNYFLNYNATGGGMQVRVFAAKFGILGKRTSEKESDAAIYQPKLTAVQGGDDYTYSNYFVGRNDFTGFSSQQIMMRDGGLKIRSDLFSDPPTHTDNWMLTMNFNTTLPENLFPVKIPLRIFMDVGTYAESWKKESGISKFLYVGGLQLTLLKGLVNFYAPVIYSKEFGNNLKTVPEENKFFKKLSFSIDIQRFNWRKMTNNAAVPF